MIKNCPRFIFALSTLLVLGVAAPSGSQQIPPAKPEEPRAAPPPPRPRAPEHPATLLLAPDADCRVILDGEDLGEFPANAMKTVGVGMGEHLILATSTEEPEVTDRVKVSIEEPGQKVVEVALAAKISNVQREREASAAPADVDSPPPGVEVTASGLATKILIEGTGTEHPTASSTVTVHYSGWTTDGERFDSSIARGKPATFPLDRVIAGWTEGLQLMVVGEKRRLWIPEDLAYRGREGQPRGMLTFDVELLEIAEPPPQAPANVAPPPPGAEVTASGLASRVLVEGTGRRRPTATSTVTVHYTGWTTDGVMFDSSRSRGQPTKFPLNRVIAGWTEGLQLMVEGEKRRLWIPERLAYKGQPGRPAGMLIFDVELIEIQ